MFQDLDDRWYRLSCKEAAEGETCPSCERPLWQCECPSSPPSVVDLLEAQNARYRAFVVDLGRAIDRWVAADDGRAPGDIRDAEDMLRCTARSWRVALERIDQGGDL